MANKRRQTLDPYIWSLFVEACGGRCVYCGATDVPLQRGHVQRHADDGPGTPENIQPLCAACNGRANQRFAMEDKRPDEWASNFIKILAKKLRLEGVIHPALKNGQGDTPLTDQQTVDSKVVISVSELTFVPHSNLYNTPTSSPTSTTCPAPRTPTLAAIETAVQKLITAGKDHPVSIVPPLEKVQDKLKRLAQTHGPEKLMLAGSCFLDKEGWFDVQDDNRVSRHDRNPWLTFVDNFSMFLTEAQARQVRRAKQRAEEHDKAKRHRWNEYLSVAKATWRTMTDADREFVAGVAKLQSEPSQDVSEADYQRASNIRSRYQSFMYRKQGLLDKLNRKLTRMSGVLDSDNERHIAIFYQLRGLAKEISATDFNDPKIDEYEEKVKSLGL